MKAGIGVLNNSVSLFTNIGDENILQVEYHRNMYSYHKKIESGIWAIICVRWYHLAIINFTSCWHYRILTVSYNVDVGYVLLSHTWVRYPGFSGHGVKCPILTTVVPGFSGDLIGCTIQSQWGPFGDLHLARKKNFFVCEISCFWVK